MPRLPSFSAQTYYLTCWFLFMTDYYIRHHLMLWQYIIACKPYIISREPRAASPAALQPQGSDDTVWYYFWLLLLQPWSLVRFIASHSHYYRLVNPHLNLTPSNQPVLTRRFKAVNTTARLRCSRWRPFWTSILPSRTAMRLQNACENWPTCRCVRQY